jgi:hypothetical protein
LMQFSRFQGWEQGFPNFHGEPSREISESRTIRMNWCVHTTLDAICRSSSSSDKKRRDQQKWTTTKTNAPDDGPCKNWDWPLPFPSTVLKN